MRLSRIITAVAVGLAVSSLPAATAAAQPVYPPGLPSLTVDTPTVQVGDTITHTGSNFGPNEIVDITVTITPLAARAPGATTRGGGTTVAMAMVPVARQLPQRVGGETFQAETDAAGNFQVQHQPRHPGIHTYTATGRESGRTASTTVTVLSEPRLPVTGDDLSTPIAVGGGLLAAGVLLMLVTLMWRRRARGRGEAPEFEAAR